MELVSKSINVGTRKINATWTREMAEDIRNYHSIDVVAELEAILAEELNRSIWNKKYEKPTRQIFSDIDPYGEENWD